MQYFILAEKEVDESSSEMEMSEEDFIPLLFEW
jgi:hypothetical protein